MTDPPNAASLSEPSPAVIEAEADHLRQQLEHFLAEQRATRLVLLIATLALLLIMAVFGLALYSTVTENLSREKLETALMARSNDHLPRLQRTAAEALSLALPTYQELAVEKMHEIRPALAAEATQIAEQMPKRLEAKLNARLEKLRVEIEAMTRHEIQERFGYLDEDQIERLTLHFTDELIKAGESVQGRVDTMYMQQRMRLEDVLLKFDIPDAMSEDELQRMLIEKVALLVVHLVRNPDQLPVYPTLEGGLK